MQLLDRLVRTVKRLFPKDKTKPNVLVSLLSKGQYYASVARYPKGKYKTVVVSAYGNSLDDVIFTLSDELCNLYVNDKTNGLYTALLNIK